MGLLDTPIKLPHRCWRQLKRQPYAIGGGTRSDARLNHYAGKRRFWFSINGGHTRNRSDACENSKYRLLRVIAI